MVVIVIVPLVTCNAPYAAISVYEPGTVIDRPLNVATPLTTVAVWLPSSCAPPGPDPMTTYTLPVAVVTGLFEESSRMTVTGLSVAPTGVGAGRVPKARWFTTAGVVMLKALLLTVNPPSAASVAVSVKLLPAVSM